MKCCEQTKNLSVYEHGISVKNYTFDLLNHLRFGTQLKYEWLLPDWIHNNKEEIIKSLPSNDIIEQYTIYHDCGKPFCLTIDNDGKKHFPNHAQISHDTYMSIFNNETVGNLILNDMMIHTIKANEVEKFVKIDNYQTLLIVGLAEIHSNSTMFGGLESTSFKIKNKTISQRGKAIFNKQK